MTSSTSPGSPEVPSGPQPTWRDLPEEPPYGPVRPPRTAHIGPAFPQPVDVEDPSTISPTQIALAVGGTLLLVAVGIGAALLLLRGPDEVAEVDPPPPPASAPAEEEPEPLPALPTPPPAPQDPPQGQLQPQPAPGQPPAGPQGQPPTVQPPGEDLPGLTPPPDQAPGDAPAGASEEAFDLPRLFVLRTLPSGMSEESTTVRQTTRDDEVVIEQTTLLGTDEGEEITVRATRADDAEQRLQAALTDEAEELSVRGVPAHLLEEGRLVWLLPGDPSTLMEMTAPTATRTDQLLTIGNGLELVR